MQDQGYALFGIVMDGNAIQALEAFAVRNAAVFFNRIVVASDLTNLTRAATVGTTRYPAAQTQQTAQCHKRTKRTNIAAKGLEPDHS